jgi:hypothetical protein
MGYRLVVLAAASCCLLASCGSTSPAGEYTFDALSPGAQAALPGADKIILSLKPEGQVSLDAGPMNLLSTTWKAEGDKVTFGQGQGLIGASYRLTAEGLIPQKDGKDLTDWRFKRK